MNVELERGVEPLRMNELIDQGHPLFIGKLLGREERYEHYEV